MCWQAINLFAGLLLMVIGGQSAQRDRDSWLANSTAEISGQVVISRDGSPVKDVIVSLERFGGPAVDQLATDSRGKFRFAGIPRSHYAIVVSAKGFVTQQRQIDLQLMPRAYLVFELEPDTNRTPAADPNELIDARIPAEAKAEFERGRAALREKKIGKALEHLARAVQRYPDFYEAELLIGTTHMSQRRLAEAEIALKRALEINPNAAIALISLGEVDRLQGRFKDAEKSLLDGLKIDDRSWQGHFTLGRVYWEMGDLIRAGKHIALALQIKPDIPEAHLIAGNIFVKSGMHRNALIEYEEYLRLNPKGEYSEAARETVKKIKRMQQP